MNHNIQLMLLDAALNIKCCYELFQSDRFEDSVYGYIYSIQEKVCC